MTDFSTWSRDNLERVAGELLAALLRAHDWIQRDEQTHGRTFGIGNEARDVIEKATGIRPQSAIESFRQDYDRGDGVFVEAHVDE